MKQDKTTLKKIRKLPRTKSLNTPAIQRGISLPDFHPLMHVEYRKEQ